jgi:uncharacterized GH25 family protein
MRAFLPFWLVLAAAPVAADAHEFWIEPSSYRPPGDSVVRVSMWLGERFAGHPVLYDADHCEKFELLGPAGATPVVGRSGGATGFGRVGSSGTYVLGYLSKRYYHTMPAQRFEQYLTEEGLGHVVEARRQQGEDDRPGREAYVRFAKSILTVGDRIENGFDRRLGHALEIVPQQHPAALGPERKFSTVLLHEGEPLAGATVVAVSRSIPDRLLRAVADADGRACFTLTEPGVWMLTSIHMVRTSGDPQADWASYWASLTFEAGESAADSTDPISLNSTQRLPR